MQEVEVLAPGYAAGMFVSTVALTTLLLQFFQYVRSGSDSETTVRDNR